MIHSKGINRRVRRKGEKKEEKDYLQLTTVGAKQKKGDTKGQRP